MSSIRNLFSNQPLPADFVNNGFLSYWTYLKSKSDFKGKSRRLTVLRFFQTLFNLVGKVVADAGVEMLFLLAFWFVIKKMGQGRDLIVSMFEPGGIYDGWRIFFLVLTVMAISFSMWIIPAYLFQLKHKFDRRSEPFKNHLFFAHRMLPLVPFWLLASVLFNQFYISWLFIGLSAAQLIILYWFNHKVKKASVRKMVVVGLLILAIVLTFYLHYLFQEAYTSAKRTLVAILYVMSFLMHLVYHAIDRQILLTHFRLADERQGFFWKYYFNSLCYTLYLLLHVALLIWLFLEDRFSLAPESILLYIFSLYIFIVDLIVYASSIRRGLKLAVKTALVVIGAAIYFLPRINLNLHHYRIDKINDTTVLKNLERLRFEARYQILKQQIIADTSSEPYPIILVSGEGGGSRGGLWFSQNLINFDYFTNGKFREHIFSMSTVSGSSVGLSTVFSFWEHPQHSDNDTAWLELPAKVYANNFVGSSISGLLITDFWKSFYCGKLTSDRNSMLQSEEAYQTQRACYRVMHPELKKVPSDSIPDSTQLLKRDFMGFFYEKGNNDSLQFKKNRPLVFINTCRSNDGRRGIISPVRLSEDVFNDAIDVAGYLYDSSVYSYEGKKICAGNRHNISLGQACNMSELFPILSAPAYIDSLGSFVDGGYHENSGLKTTLDIYLELKQRLRRDGLDTAKRQNKPLYKIYIVYLKNGSGEKALYKKMESQLPLTQPLEALTSQPFEGSASYFEEKARYADYLDIDHVKFVTVKLNNTILKDSSQENSTAKPGEKQQFEEKIEEEILADLRTEKSDTILNFPLARWLSKSIIKRMRMAAFPLKDKDYEADDKSLDSLLVSINKRYKMPAFKMEKKLKPFEKLSARGAMLINERRRRLMQIYDMK